MCSNPSDCRVAVSTCKLATLSCKPITGSGALIGVYSGKTMSEGYVCIHCAAHRGMPTPPSGCRSIEGALCKTRILFWRNSGLKDAWQQLESSLSHLITGGNDCGPQVSQQDCLSCSAHCYFLPEIIMKPYQPAVMTTRRDISSPSPSAISYFLPALSPCQYHVTPLLSSKTRGCGVGAEGAQCPAAAWEAAPHQAGLLGCQKCQGCSVSVSPHLCFATKP